MGSVRDAHDYICLLNEFLLEKYREGENAALIIDEAQNLSAEVLESIRLLSNFETTKDKLLQILLVGQPELNERLNTPQLRQLKQRITLRHHLRPLSLQECQEYIATRLKHAGGNPSLFAPKAVEGIYRYSGGIPRLINVLCDNAMINAYALDHKQIDPLLIQEAADDLALSITAIRAPAVRRDSAIRIEPHAPARTELIRPQAVQLVTGNRGTIVADHSNGTSLTSVVAEKFFVSLRDALTDVMGPMAQIVLSEHVRLLGAALDRFPQEKVGSLIESVSREIFDESVRERFRQNMSEWIRRL